MTTPFLTNLRALSVRFICSVISEGMEGGGEGEERKEGEREKGGRRERLRLSRQFVAVCS